MYLVTLTSIILVIIYIFYIPLKGYASENILSSKHQNELSTTTDTSIDPLFTSNQIMDLTFAADTSY
jgi:hypothetical protein